MAANIIKDEKGGILQHFNPKVSDFLFCPPLALS